MVKDISKLIKRVSYSSTPLARSLSLGNLINYNGSLILSGRASLRLLGLYFLNSSNVTSLVSMTFLSWGTQIQNIFNKLYLTRYLI
jgi:hypothetical protein